MDVAALLVDLETEYVRTLNAVLAAPPLLEHGRVHAEADVNRWRGQAEAYRQVCERIRRELGLPAVRYQSEEWRRMSGVYEPGQFAGR